MLRGNSSTAKYNSSGALGVKSLGGNSTVATRIFEGRMQTISSPAVMTYQITCALAQHFDAVQLIFANTSGTLSPYITAVAVSVVANTSDLNNSSGTWVAGTKEGQTTFPLEIANNNGGHRKGYTLTDWIPISSLARDDGGSFPLLIARCLINNAVAALPVYGDPGDDFTNWATKPDGRIWAARQQNVSGVTTPTNFTSTINRSASPIIGVRYLARGKVITVMSNGDSIWDGRGTYLGEGFVMPTTYTQTSQTATAIEYSTCSWAGDPQGTLYNGMGFANNGLDILENDELRPDILVFPCASPNDVTGSPTLITAAMIMSFRQITERMINSCAEHGVIPIIGTWLPSNTSVKTYGSTDALRVAYNTEVLSWQSRGLLVADLATVISGAPDGTTQIQMLAGTNSDGIHPNDTGNTLLSNALLPYLQQAIG